jgi:hypothetical protein
MLITGSPITNGAGRRVVLTVNIKEVQDAKTYQRPLENATEMYGKTGGE